MKKQTLCLKGSKGLMNLSLLKIFPAPPPPLLPSPPFPCRTAEQNNQWLFSWSLQVQSCQSLTHEDHPSFLAQTMAVEVDHDVVMVFQKSKLYWRCKIDRGWGISWKHPTGCQTGSAYPSEELSVHDCSWPLFFPKKRWVFDSTTH